MNLNTPQTIEELSLIVADVLGIDKLELREDMTAHDVDGWDSLSHVRILHECELKWNLRLTLDQLSGLNTIGDLIRIIDDSLTSNS